MQTTKPAVRAILPNSVLYQLLIVITMMTFWILWARFYPFTTPTLVVESLPMTRAKFNSLMAELPKELRSSAETVGSTYYLFSEAQVRFEYTPTDSTGPTSLAEEVTKVILDEKLCLYFYRDPSESDYWTYDGFESGDYANPEPESLEFREVE